MVGVPYVVMVGDVGTGKSTVVDKLTLDLDDPDAAHRSSASSKSATRYSEQFYSYDKGLLIGDTPGSNAIDDKLGHNIEIAYAINYAPVWKLFLIAKADVRIDNVVDNIRKYAERLLDLPMDALGVLVTHMDTVTWTETEFKRNLQKDLGFNSVVFTGLKTSREELQRDILNLCDKPSTIRINDENFLKLFKINNNNLKIMRDVNREVEDFKVMKRQFDEVEQSYLGKDKVDLLFSFQTWMYDQIIEAQMRVSAENEFDFYGAPGASEAGHIANMTNQMRTVFYDLRLEVSKQQSSHSIKVARKCPHCGLVWCKFEGCDGGTTCGKRPSQFDVRDSSFTVLGIFEISWTNGRLNIKKAEEGKKLTHVRTVKDANAIGCGKEINWSTMQIVEIPTEWLAAGFITMDDNVPAISSKVPNAQGFMDKLKGMLGPGGKKIMEDQEMEDGEGQDGEGQDGGGQDEEGKDAEGQGVYKPLVAMAAVAVVSVVVRAWFNKGNN